MTSRTFKFGRLCLATAMAAGLLAACDGDDDDDRLTTVPASASESSANFISYLRDLAPSDTEEPLLLDGFIAPIDDTSESTPLS